MKENNQPMLCKCCHKNLAIDDDNIYCSECLDPDNEPEEEDFQPCCDCDLPDACADFGCAIKNGITASNNQF